MSRRNKSRPTMSTVDAQPTTDAFQNLLAKLGYGSGNLTESAQYPLTRLTRNYQLMNSLYREHWVVRKVIDTIPDDMCKNWMKLTCQVSPDQIDQFQKVERKTMTKIKIATALKWGRLYGGAAAVIMIHGHEGILDQPLDLDSVMPGSYKGLLVLDRWSGITPSSMQEEDINSPDFGLPASYRVTTETGQSFEVHASRVLRFLGRDLPYWEKQAENHWGSSEVEVIFDELKKRDNTSWNAAALVFLANIRTLKMGDLGQVLASNNAKAQENLYNTLSAQNRIMSNMGMMVLGKDDEFDSKSYTFAGLSEILELQMYDLSGATGIPCTKLFGRSPAGMNSTGDSDLTNYYDMLGGAQENELGPQMDKLIPIIALSAWGFVPDDLDYDWLPCQTAQADKVAEIAGKKSGVIYDGFNAGIFSQKTALQELRQMSDETGMWTNITDEDIDAADDQVQPQGELPMMGEFGGVSPGSNRGATGEQDVAGRVPDSVRSNRPI